MMFHEPILRNGRRIRRVADAERVSVMATEHPPPRDRAELLAEADRIRAMSAGPLEDSVSLLRDDRACRPLVVEATAHPPRQRSSAPG